MMLFPNMDMLADLPREPFAGGPYVIGAKRRLPKVIVPIEAKENPN